MNNHNNAYVKFVSQHGQGLKNALTKGIPFPVDITSDFYNEWRFTNLLFERRVKAEGANPSQEFLDEAANDALSHESLIEAVRFAQQDQPWSDCEEGRHFAEMERMPSSRVAKAMAALENLLPAELSVALKNAITTMVRNQEMNRSMFWVSGKYDDEDGSPASFLVEASDVSEAMSIVNDYCDQLGDGAAPITGAPDSWTFVPESCDGAKELLEVLANMQYPVLSREMINEI